MTDLAPSVTNAGWKVQEMLGGGFVHESEMEFGNDPVDGVILIV